MPFNILNVRRDMPQSHKGIIVYWLAGTGFVVKFATGEIVCLDPYLSDCVERLAGFRRLSLAPLEPHELTADVLLFTHDHPDHLDPDSFDAIMAANPSAKILAGGSCRKFLKEKNIEHQICPPGTLTRFGAITVKAVAADHGEYCAEALGFIIQFAGRSLYFTGDTSLNQTLLADAINSQPEILIPCINGAFGNLNENEAANLASQCRAGVVVPTHFGLFAEHGGSPAKFKECLNTVCPQAKLVLLTPGLGAEL
jgi:L-ascorbate 6-phosphate lactonase